MLNMRIIMARIFYHTASERDSCVGDGPLIGTEVAVPLRSEN